MYLHERNRLYDRFNFKVIAPPVDEHISVAEARDHLRIIPFGSPPEAEEDSWLTTNISVAREWCEWWSMCALRVQTLELGIRAFPGSFANMGTFGQAGWLPWWHLQVDRLGIMLPMASPFITLDSIKYDDGSGVVQTLDPATYYVNDYEKPAAAYPLNSVWPVAQFNKMNAVRVRYTCGYSLDSDSPMLTLPLPFQFKAAMLLVLGHLHENRENTAEVELFEIPNGAASLMERYRCRLGMA
jgi:hypothetical protein